jgi:hypothetical protein
VDEELLAVGGLAVGALGLVWAPAAAAIAAMNRMKSAFFIVVQIPD